MLAERVTGGMAASRSVALARLWFQSPDDEDGRALQLYASAGTPSGGGSYERLDGEFRQMAISESRIAEIATTGVALVVRGLRGDENWLINPEWVARQGVRAFIGLPLIDDAGVVGVLAIFDREIPDDRILSELALVVDVAAARVPDLRARRPPSPLATSIPSGGDGGLWEGRRSPVTRAEFRRLERGNIEAALAQTQGRVFGETGAAVLLGMKPTTLASRIKALGINRR